MKAIFKFPTRVVFGEGVSDDLAQEMTLLGIHRPLLITDRGLVEAGLADKLLETLRKGGLEPALFDKVTANPTDGQCEAGAAAYRQHNADGVAALGGGSPIDAGKGIALRIHHKDPMEVYDDLAGGDARISEPVPPLVAIPTTAGTGAEVSRSAVLTVEAVERKVVVFSPRLMPALAVCDPALTYGLPPRLTAETGMDALSHNLEAYLAKGYHPMADAIALEGVAKVARYLRRAVENGEDEQARREMLMASTMGAVAFQKGLGVAHSLAHALSPVSSISHGLANAVLLPHVVRFNGVVVPDRVRRIGEAAGAADTSVSGVAAFFADLQKAIGLPWRLSQCGVEADALDQVVQKALADGCHCGNPRTCSKTEMTFLFNEAL
jgi:alcohol dehydrogenase class IV